MMLIFRDFNHLFIKQGQALQAQAAFVEKLKFRPHSTDTLTHRKVTLNMASKTGKSQKVKVITDVGDNPETQKQVQFLILFLGIKLKHINIQGAYTSRGGEIKGTKQT